MDSLYKRFSKLDQPEILPYIFPVRKDYSEDIPKGVVEHFTPVEAGVKIAARLYLAAPADPSILFFHGNGEIARDYDNVGPSYNRYGFSFMAVDYRGYGKSSGEPTVEAMLHDAHTVFEDIRRLLKERGQNGPLVVMGRSLGSVAAIELAAAHDDEIAALILDSAFASTVALLERIGISVSGLGISEEDGLINVTNIARVTSPTLIIHGQRDSLIPLADVEMLMSYAGARKKQLLVVPGADHNDIMSRCGEAYFGTIRDFVIGRPRKRFFQAPGRI